MVIFGIPSDEYILCMLLLLLGVYIRLVISQRRFKRKNLTGKPQFRSYYHALLKEVMAS